MHHESPDASVVQRARDVHALCLLRADRGLGQLHTVLLASLDVPSLELLASGPSCKRPGLLRVENAPHVVRHLGGDKLGRVALWLSRLHKVL